MKKYVYFVSYNHTVGHGRCEITVDKKVTSINDILNIEKTLNETHCIGVGEVKNTLVNNIILLRKEHKKKNIKEL